MISTDYKEKIGGMRFPDWLSSKINLYLQLSSLDGSALEVQTFVQGL